MSRIEEVSIQLRVENVMLKAPLAEHGITVPRQTGAAAITVASILPFDERILVEVCHASS